MVQGNPDHVYDSPALAAFVEELKSDFDLIVFDLPPCGDAHAPLRLAEQFDGVLLVVEAERVRQQAARRVRELLSHPVCGSCVRAQPAPNLSAANKMAGDCPNFAMSAKQNGTVSLFDAILLAALRLAIAGRDINSITDCIVLPEEQSVGMWGPTTQINTSICHWNSRFTTLIFSDHDVLQSGGRAAPAGAAR